MSKVRINDLARELEVKSKAILDSLPLVGVTEKKTHSSSLEEHEAEKVRAYFRAAAEAQPATSKSARASRGEEEIKTTIDLSNISRPGDVLKAITQQKEAVAPTARAAAPAVPKPPVAPPVAKPAAPPAVAATAPATPVQPAPPVRPTVAPPERPAAPAASTAAPVAPQVTIASATPRPVAPATPPQAPPAASISASSAPPAPPPRAAAPPAPAA